MLVFLPLAVTFSPYPKMGVVWFIPFQYIHIFSSTVPDKRLDQKSDKGSDQKSNKDLDLKSDKELYQKLNKRLYQKSDNELDQKSNKGLDQKSDNGLDKKSDNGLDQKSDNELDQKSNKESDQKSNKRLDKNSDKILDQTKNNQVKLFCKSSRLNPIHKDILTVTDVKSSSHLTIKKIEDNVLNNTNQTKKDQDPGTSTPCSN